MSTCARRDTLIGLALLGLTLLVFFPVLGHGFIALDDDVYVTANPMVLDGLTPQGLRAAFLDSRSGLFLPLTWLSYMIDASLFGPGAAGFHATNLALHLANTALLFWLLRSFTGAAWPSAAVALLFAVHPLHVEPVAWISGRKDVLSTLFCFLTLAAYGRYVRKPGPTRYAPVLLCYTLGLLAKPMLVTLPMILLLLDYWPLRRVTGAKDLARPALEKLPLFMLSAVAIGLSLHHAAAERSVAGLGTVPLAPRLANVFVNYAAYIAQTFLPLGLSVDYPYNTGGPPTGLLLLSIFIVAALTLLALVMVRRAPWFFTGWGWYLVTLAPVSGLLIFGSQARADRYTYVPLIGLFIVLAWAGALALAKHPRFRRLAAAACAVACALLMGTAHVQARAWQDSRSLFLRSLNAVPSSPTLRINLAAVLLEDDENRAAADYLEDVLETHPRSPRARINLGVACARMGRKDEAAAHFRQVLVADPGNAAAQRNLAWVEEMGTVPSPSKTRSLGTVPISGADWLARGEHEKALAAYESELASAPENPDLLVNTAIALAFLERYEEAEARLRHALEKAPEHTGALFNLANLLVVLGRPDEAAKLCDALIRLQPQDEQALRLRALALERAGQDREAGARAREPGADLHAALRETQNAGRGEAGAASPPLRRKTARPHPYVNLYRHLPPRSTVEPWLKS